MGEQFEQNSGSDRCVVDRAEEVDLFGGHLHRLRGHQTTVEGGDQEVRQKRQTVQEDNGGHLKEPYHHFLLRHEREQTQRVEESLR